MPKRLTDAMEFSHHVIPAYMDRELRCTDVQVFNDPARNPRFFEPGTRTVGDETPEEWAYLIFAEQSTDRLYEILDGPFLLLIDGQVIHNILIERGAWDESRIGAAATYTPCFCSICSANATEADDERAETFAEDLAHTLIALTRSAA